MRTYGRVKNSDGSLTWVEVQTDANGHDDYVWLTTLIQCLKLNIGESPFYASYGIPARQSILQQIFPDFYVTQAQIQFSPYFSSLVVSKQAPTDRLHIDPVYNISVVTNFGVKLAVSVAT